MLIIVLVSIHGILINLPCDKHSNDIIKNGRGIISSRVLNGYIQNGKRQIPQYLSFGCGMTHLNYSLKKLGKTFILQNELSKTEMNQDEVDGNNYRYKKNEWLDYVDVLRTGFSYARYTKAMEEIIGSGMKYCLSVPGLGWKFFNSSRTKKMNQFITIMTNT